MTHPNLQSETTTLHFEKFMRVLTFTFLFLVYAVSFGQTNPNQNLLDTALSGHGALFVSSKPITHIRLDPDDMSNYFHFHRDYSNKVLDTVMFAQIIHKSKAVDTTAWQDNELKNYLLVKTSDENVLTKYATKKLRLTDKRQIIFYKKQINRYNSTDSYHRNLYYFSKPVFDNSKQFAIVQWYNAHSGLDGGGGIILFQLQGDTWKDVGVIMNWKY
jgi:hypothetical protein